MFCHSPVHHFQVFLLPPSVSLQTGALCEPLSCLVHGWERLVAVSPVQPGSRVVSISTGTCRLSPVHCFKHSA